MEHTKLYSDCPFFLQGRAEKSHPNLLVLWTRKNVIRNRIKYYIWPAGPRIRTLNLIELRVHLIGGHLFPRESVANARPLLDRLRGFVGGNNQTQTSKTRLFSSKHV